MTKHTKGPWRAEWTSRTNNEPRRGWHVFSGSPDNPSSDVNLHGPICTLPDRGAQDMAQVDANARLIAAAPDLLKSLKDSHQILFALYEAETKQAAKKYLADQLDKNTRAIASAEGL